MSRGPRISYEQAFYHVYNRGVARLPIFQDESDYRKFLKRLVELKTKKGFDHSIYAYVLMPNHFHLLIQTRKTPISKIMTSLATSYSMYFNKTYHRVGPLFQNRFKSKLCDKDAYFLGASRYILLNPIEAGLAKRLEDYPWSSYQELFGSLDMTIIDREEVSLLVGTTKKEKEKYRMFLLDGIRNLKEITGEYTLDREIEGSPLFQSLSQKKYLRRKRMR